MKIFDKDGKINFVDENNVLVGFDSVQWCCEDFGFYISELSQFECMEEGRIKVQTNSPVDDYNFNPNFFETHSEAVSFELVAQNKPNLYLFLYNFHNGYYSHGFTATVNGIRWEEGSI